MKFRVSTITLFFALALPLVSYAGSYTMCPDGSYVGSDTCSMTPDGSYVGGKSSTMTPDGSYVGGKSYTMTPDSNYVGRGESTRQPSVLERLNPRRRFPFSR